MGNRAVITTAPYSDTNVGIYVHWNGGRESIEGFLEAAKELGYRSPGEDNSYAMARLVQAIGVYFGGELSLGVDLCSNLDTDNGNNGTYLIGPDWEVVGRKFFDGEDEVDEERTKAVAARIVRRTRLIEEIG